MKSDRVDRGSIEIFHQIDDIRAVVSVIYYIIHVFFIVLQFFIENAFNIFVMFVLRSRIEIGGRSRI